MDGWFLPRDAVSELVAKTIDETIRRAKGAHETDIDMRINGRNERHQADWIKYMQRISEAQADNN